MLTRHLSLFTHLCILLWSGQRGLLHYMLQVFDGLQQHAFLLLKLQHLLSQCRSSNLLLLDEERGEGNGRKGSGPGVELWEESGGGKQNTK